MEVAEQDGGLGAGDAEDHEHKEEEAEHVVGLGGPDGVQDEEQLDENAAKGQHPAHHAAGQGLRVDALLGDLPGDFVRAHRVLQGLMTKRV